MHGDEDRGTTPQEDPIARMLWGWVIHVAANHTWVFKCKQAYQAKDKLEHSRNSWNDGEVLCLLPIYIISEGWSLLVAVDALMIFIYTCGKQGLIHVRLYANLVKVVFTGQGEIVNTPETVAVESDRNERYEQIQREDCHEEGCYRDDYRKK